VIAAPVLALSTLNWTLATATSSVAVAVSAMVPESVAFDVGVTIEIVGGVVSVTVVNVRSPLTAAVFVGPAECTR
jgi:hypothetical protein